MTKLSPPIPIYQLALLLAYLYEIFTAEKSCEQNFRHSRCYLTKNFSEEKIEEIIKFFNNKSIKCDCDVIKKLDLKDFSVDTLSFHE